MIKAIRTKSGMTITEFSNFLKIPYRTIQNWENGERRAPAYVIDLIEYKLKNEGIIKEPKKEILYSVRTAQIEIKKNKNFEKTLTKNDIENAFFNDDIESKEVIRVKTKKEAEEELKKIDVWSSDYEYNNLYLCKIAFYEENTYDEEGEFIEGSNISDIKCEEIL